MELVYRGVISKIREILWMEEGRLEEVGSRSQRKRNDDEAGIACCGALESQDLLAILRVGRLRWRPFIGWRSKRDQCHMSRGNFCASSRPKTRNRHQRSRCFSRTDCGSCPVTFCLVRWVISSSPCRRATFVCCHSSHEFLVLE